MAFTLSIETDNDVFNGGNIGTEIKRILEDVALHVYYYQRSEGVVTGRVYDINGNRVGEWKVTP